VGVAVDQARQDRAAGRVDAVVAVQVRADSAILPSSPRTSARNGALPVASNTKPPDKVNEPTVASCGAPRLDGSQDSSSTRFFAIGPQTAPRGM